MKPIRASTGRGLPSSRSIQAGASMVGASASSSHCTTPRLKPPMLLRRQAVDKTCGTCGKSVDMTFCGDCRDCQIDSYDEDANDCHNCGGEGFTYGCDWDWQCETWDGDSCLCTR